MVLFYISHEQIKLLTIAANCVFGDDLCAHYFYTILSDWLLSTAEASLWDSIGTPPCCLAH